MDNTYTERWIGLYAGQCCSDGCIEDMAGHGIIHGASELSTGPLQRYLVDLHNLAVEHGGIQAMKEKLARLE